MRKSRDSVEYWDFLERRIQKIQKETNERFVVSERRVANDIVITLKRDYENLEEVRMK